MIIDKGQQKLVFEYYTCELNCIYKNYSRQNFDV